MVGKSIVHKADGSIGLITEYHAIPENSDLTGIIRAIYPATTGDTPEHRVYIEVRNGMIAEGTYDNEYTIIDEPNS